jgi:hypothetical protein
MGRARWRVVALVLVTVALAAAGCGGDDDDGATTEAPGGEAAAALQEEIADLSDEEQIKRIGEAWAEPFAAGDEAMCAYLHPDLGGEGEQVCNTYVSGDLAGSIALQTSFAGTAVESVDVKGQTAVARFSNGEPVEFQQDPEGDWWVVDPSRTAGLSE